MILTAAYYFGRTMMMRKKRCNNNKTKTLKIERFSAQILCVFVYVLHFLFLFRFILCICKQQRKIWTTITCNYKFSNGTLNQSNKIKPPKQIENVFFPSLLRLHHLLRFLSCELQKMHLISLVKDFVFIKIIITCIRCLYFFLCGLFDCK